MSASEYLEIGASLALIVGVWFALIGWKLISLARARRQNRTAAP